MTTNMTTNDQRSRVLSEDGTSPGEWEAVGFYGDELATNRPAYTVLTVYGEVARAYSAADARLIAAAVNAYRTTRAADHPLADGTDAGAMAVILDEAKDGPWKPDDGTSLWFYNEAGDQLHLTGDDVALLLNAALERQ